jgi:hypothetical protein
VEPAEVGFNCADPDAASLAELTEPPRHHIGRFSTPQKGYFAPTLLAHRDRLLIVGWSEQRRLSRATRPGAAQACYPSQTPGMPCGVSGPGLPVNEDRFGGLAVTTTTQGRRSENRSKPTSCAGTESASKPRQGVDAQGLPQGQRGPGGSPRGERCDVK